MNTQFIGIYPISFIQTTWVRRLLLVVLMPVVVLGNAAWYFLPLVRPLKAQIFRNGFWNAVWSGTVVTWRSAVPMNQAMPMDALDDDSDCGCPCDHREDNSSW